MEFDGSIIEIKENPLTGDFLVYFPDTAYAWYLPTNRNALEFKAALCNAFRDGRLEIVDGKIVNKGGMYDNGKSEVSKG